VERRVRDCVLDAGPRDVGGGLPAPADLYCYCDDETRADYQPGSAIYVRSLDKYGEGESV
jgi:hypothetical protein